MPRGVHTSQRGTRPRFTPEERQERDRASMKRARRRQLEKEKAERRRKLGPLPPRIEPQEAIEAGLSITRRRHSCCYWMDAKGKLHREDSRSAQEVIRDWENAHKKGERP